jgi:hypothetical protein
LVKYFKNWNSDLACQPCSGCPQTACTERNKKKVDELIRQNPHVTVKEVAAEIRFWHSVIQEMMKVQDTGKFVSAVFLPC